MEITLADLLNLEPRLIAGAGLFATNGTSLETADRIVSWAVTARTTLPHLPLLRGGEVLLLPSRVTAAVDHELPALIRESASRGVSAIVFEQGDPTKDTTYPDSQSAAVMSWSEELSADTETTINRLLTECRGDLYRLGTDLERQMTDAAASRSGIRSLVESAAQISGLSIHVLDSRGRRVAAAPESDFDAELAESTPDPRLLRRVLPRGETLVVRAIRPEQGVVARFLVDRIAAAASAALQRDDAARPRGLHRADAIAALVSGRNGTPGDQRAKALALGLDPDGVYFVAVSDTGSGSMLTRALAPLGTAHAAGGANGRQLTLIAASVGGVAETLSTRLNDVKSRWDAEGEGSPQPLALSSPAVGAASIPRAAGEADFVAAMQASLNFPRRAASFASVDDIGAMGLLYQLRESRELREFIAEALGSLQTGDQRGILKETLRAFLESGGSHVDASQRLGIHRNTLAYRLRRIGELAGRDVADPATWLPLHLALLASEMLDVCADDA